MAVSILPIRPHTAKIIPFRAPGYLVEAATGGAELIEHIADEWNALIDEIGNAPVFLRPEWFSLHLQFNPPSAPLVLLTVRSAGQLRGVLPLQSDRKRVAGVPLARLRAATDVVSPDRFDLITPEAEREAVVAALWQHLAKLPNWDVIELADVPTSGACCRLAANAQETGITVITRDSRVSAKIDIDGKPTVEAALAHLDSRFRSNLRRRRRNLEKLGPVKVTTHYATDSDFLDRFFALESAGWKGTAGTAIACDPAQRRLYTEIATVFARHGLLVMHELTCGDTVVAMNIALVHAGQFAGLKLAYNEEFREFAPGHLLVNEIVAAAVASGYRSLDFCGDAAAWKREWATDLERFERHWMFNRHPKARTAAMLRFRLLPAGRALQRKLMMLGNRG